MSKKKLEKQQQQRQEQQEQDLSMQAIVEQPKLDFDAWFSMRSSVIPPHHHKEIIKADFRARGVPSMATMEEFDRALRAYGLPV